MKIKTWNPKMSDKETANLAYWERNVLALLLADHSKGDGWYYDSVFIDMGMGKQARLDGWHRVISLRNGSITFHVPDAFHLGNLPQITPNWDGHTTHEKWARILSGLGVEVEE